MRWQMKGKIALLFFVMALWTMLTYILLFVMSRFRVDPVRIVANPAHPELRAHGMPQLDLIGSVTWLVILAIYAAGAILLVARAAPLRRPLYVLGFLSIFLLSGCYVTVVHPSLLLTMLSPDLRLVYSEFIEGHVPFLSEIYFQWGLLRLKFLVVLGQALISFAVSIALVTISRGRGRTQRSWAE